MDQWRNKLVGDPWTKIWMGNPVKIFETSHQNNSSGGTAVVVARQWWHSSGGTEEFPILKKLHEKISD